MNQPIVDVVVIGGGPAGCALSLRLARAGWSVLLLERTAYAEFRVGESLPPNAVPRLARLGVWSSFLETKPAPVYGIQSAWGTAELDSSSFLLNPFLNGWHVNRRRFDAMLSFAAEKAGARILRQTLARRIKREAPNLWSVTASSPLGELRFLSRFLVDATGRLARLCTWLGIGRQRADRLVGIARLFAEKSSGDPLPSLIETHPLGWWYSAGIPGGDMIAIFFTDSDLCAQFRLIRPDAWSSILEESRHTRDRLSVRIPSPALHTFPAASHCLHRAAGNSWLAIGDAIIGRDPLSSSGIDFALASAERASSVLDALGNGDGESVDAYNTEVRADFDAYLDQRHAYYAMERRWAESSFWRRRHERFCAHTLSP
jgi:flavin-dependent dehydrogenase